MHFSFSILTTAAAAAAALLAAVSSVSADPVPSQCTTNFTGSTWQLRAAQSAAFADFTNLWMEQRNIQLAFDRYVPGDYINHHPDSASGRQQALDVMIPFLADPQLSFTNVHVFAGDGYGVVHHRLWYGTASLAVMDKYRFVGTCIVEHWDVGQGITGFEANPIAFF